MEKYMQVEKNETILESIRNQDDMSLVNRTMIKKIKKDLVTTDSKYEQLKSKFLSSRTTGDKNSNDDSHMAESLTNSLEESQDEKSQIEKKAIIEQPKVPKTVIMSKSDKIGSNDDDLENNSQIFSETDHDKMLEIALKHIGKMKGAKPKKIESYYYEKTQEEIDKDKEEEAELKAIIDQQSELLKLYKPNDNLPLTTM